MRLFFVVVQLVMRHIATLKPYNFHQILLAESKMFLGPLARQDIRSLRRFDRRFAYAQVDYTSRKSPLAASTDIECSRRHCEQPTLTNP